MIYFWVINDWLTTAEGDSAATLGCGFRGVRRESEGYVPRIEPAAQGRSTAFGGRAAKGV